MDGFQGMKEIIQGSQHQDREALLRSTDSKMQKKETTLKEHLKDT